MSQTGHFGRVRLVADPPDGTSQAFACSSRDSKRAILEGLFSMPVLE
jgi:hypothetical protein